MRGAEADTFTPLGWPGPDSEPYNSDPWYGTLGVGVAYNGKGAGTVPGGRNSSAYWTGKDGTFWLFGGDGLDGNPAPAEGLLNDLWAYTPATNEWTWKGGSSTIETLPAYLGPGSGGQPGVYGTLGTPSSSNIPGGRENSVTWTDSAGNLWLFGGYGIDSQGSEGYLNDLWEFNPTSGKWAWVGGSNTIGTYLSGQVGTYGVQGVPAPNNVPPGLSASTGWIDQNGNFWLFGGYGVSLGLGAGAAFDDVWEFTPATMEWTWVSGNGGTIPNEAGVYGTLGTPAAGNHPSSRASSTAWTDASGNVWLFGGGNLNDLWKFNPTSKQWAWMAGTAGDVLVNGVLSPPPGSYGALGVAAASNAPSGRFGSTGWLDTAGNLWIFGGNGIDSTDADGPLNDLWEFNMAKQEWIWMGGPEIGLQGGVYGIEGTPSSANIPGSRYNSASWRDSSGNLWLFAGWGILSGPDGGATALNDLWVYNPSQP